MNPISNKILTTAIQTADTLSETSQASTAQQNPKAATSDSIGKAMSNFDLIKSAGNPTSGIAQGNSLEGDIVQVLMEYQKFASKEAREDSKVQRQDKQLSQPLL